MLGPEIQGSSSACQVAETTERVPNRMLESVIRVSRLPAVVVKDVCVGESHVVIEYGDGKRRRNVGNVGAADQQTTRPCTAATPGIAKRKNYIK